jgi:hypothetical protein
MNIQGGIDPGATLLINGMDEKDLQGSCVLSNVSYAE